MSGTVRRRESRERLLKSEPSLTKDPEDLKNEEKKENNKRPVTGGVGDTPASLPPPESFILLIKTNA
jgi:hypothetical protein